MDTTGFDFAGFNVPDFHDDLRARGMGHIADGLEHAAAHPEPRNEALEVPIEAAPPVEAPAPAAVEPVAAPVAEADAIPPWAGELVGTVQDFGRFMELVNGELEAERAAAVPAAPVAPAPVTPELNLYDADSVRAYIDSVNAAQATTAEERAEQMFAEKLGPYQPLLDALAQQEGEKLAREHLDVLAKGDGAAFAGIGDFDRDHALLLANSYMANGVKPADAFLAAARMTQQFEQRIRSGGAAANEAALARAAGAPAEPAAPAAPGAEVERIDGRDPDRYEKLADQWLNRRRAEQAAGSSPVG